MLYYILKFIDIVKIPAVNIFVIISGYFGIQPKFSVKRVLLLWLQVFFYSVAIFAVTAAVGINSFSWSELVKSFLPVMFNKYWFFSVFIGLYIFSPFLNIVLKKLSNMGFQYLFGLCFVLFTIVESIPGIFTYNPEAGNGIMWFFILYSVGAYLNRFPPKHKAITYFGIAVACFIVSFAGSIAITYVSNKFGFDGVGSSRLSTYGTFPIYFASIAIVSMVLKCAEKDFVNFRVRKTILFFSGSAFSVYMIHESPYLRGWLWQEINLPRFAGTPLVILIMLLVAVAIFLASVAIDKVTWVQVKKLLVKIDTSRIDEKINRWVG